MPFDRQAAAEKIHRYPEYGEAEKQQTATEDAPTGSEKGGAASAGSICTELVVIDEIPIRKKLRTGLKRARTYYQKAQIEWEQYQTETLPAFEAWIKRVEGVLPMKIAELEQDFTRKRMILEDVEELAFDYRISHAEAYARIMDMMEHPDKYPQPEAPKFEDDAFWGDEDEDEDEWSDEDEEAEFNETMLALLESVLSGEVPLDVYRSFLFEVLGINAYNMKDAEVRRHAEEHRDELRGEQGRPNAAPNRPPESGAEGRGARLKQKYRQIVKALHPDSAEEFNEDQRRLWLEVQDAYEQGDEDFLDVVLAQMRLKSDESGVHSCWDLKAALTFYRQSLKALRKTLTREKKGTAWQFSTMDDVERDRNERAMRRHLEDDYRTVQRMSKQVDKEYRRVAKERAKFDVEAFRREHVEGTNNPQDPVDVMDIFEEMLFGSGRPSGGKKAKGSKKERVDPFQDAFEFF